jgi:hypothetical protein
VMIGSGSCGSFDSGPGILIRSASAPGAGR